MRLTLEKKKKFYLPNDPDKGWVEIRDLSQHEIDLIREKNSTTLMGVNGAEFEVMPTAQSHDLARACLSDWGNMIGTDDKPLHFNKENIESCATINIVDGDTTRSFFSFVNKCRMEFAQDVKQQKEESEGN